MASHSTTVERLLKRPETTVAQVISDIKQTPRNIPRKYRSDKYEGAKPFKPLKVIKRILKLMRSCIANRMHFLWYWWEMFMFRCRRKDSGRYIWTCWSILIIVSVVHTKVKYRVQSESYESMHKYFRRMATDIFLHAANVSKVVDGGRGLPCIRQTVTRYFIDMNVSHRTPMCLQYSSQIVETETVCLEFSLKFPTFTIHTFVLTQKCPSPSPVLSHVYFGALRWL